MRHLANRPYPLALTIAAICLLFVTGGCVISPRRVANVSPSPTPTPTPGTTPTPTPTPTPMSATVSTEFLFLGESDAPQITAFRIQSDGSLAPVPGSPFAISAPAQALAAPHDILFVATEKGTIAFRVEKETGLLQQTGLAGISMTARDAFLAAGIGPQMAALDAGERFMFVADVNRDELIQYRMDHGRPSALPVSAIPIPHSTTSIAVVKP